MKPKRVAFIEFPVIQDGMPIASGYLESHAIQHPGVRDNFEFEKWSLFVNSPSAEETLETIDADIYAFSCYVWNTGLVKRLVPRLLQRRPAAHVMLGGPQVMKKAGRYLDPAHERLVLCNGEGERTFTNYLVQLADDDEDFSKIPGLSFYRDGLLQTTPDEQRISRLDEIPSPYLEGRFDPQQYTWALIETNRGCPFKCTYCYWGAAINVRVHKFALDRVLNELEWLSKNHILYVVFADANFGIYDRDVEIAEHLARLKREHGFPMTVYFSSSKNTPERVCKITEILEQAGMIATQPVSLQTMSEQTLINVKRNNIKTSSYTELQRTLNQRRASSFIELIWPLPGETFESYRAGVGQLCTLAADAFAIYPLLMINNVEMESQRDEFEIVTIDDPNPNSEAEIVIGTRDVSFDDYKEGLRLSFHVTSMYSFRGLWFVGRYLDAEGICDYGSLFSRFSTFCRSRPAHPYTDQIERTIDVLNQTGASGALGHICLHAYRREFGELLSEFVAEQGWLDEAPIRLRLELDLINRPHLYRNTPIPTTIDQLQMIQAEPTEDGYVLHLPESHMATARQLLSLPSSGHRHRLRIRYRTNQLPYMAAKPLAEHYAYCEDRLRRIRSILPEWNAVPAVDADDPADTVRWMAEQAAAGADCRPGREEIEL